MKQFLITLAFLCSLAGVACADRVVSLAATTQLLSSLKNPVSGTLGLEYEGVRFSASLGADDRESFALDAISHLGYIVTGVGLVVDRSPYDDSITVTSSTDTTVTVTPHDHGKHRGDKRIRKGKKIVTIRSQSAYVTTLGGVEIGMSPSVLPGIEPKRGVYLESRLLFGSGDVLNRTSVGVRW